MDVHEFEKLLVGVSGLFILLWLLSVLEEEERGELVNLELLQQRLFRLLNDTEFQSFL